MSTNSVAHSPKATQMKLRCKRLATTALCLSLLAFILSKSMLASLSTTHVDLAASITHSPTTQFAFGDEAIQERLQNLEAREKLEIRNSIRSALRAEPFNARGLEIMGLLAASNDDTKTADQFISNAVRQSLRRHAAVYWSLQRKLAAKDYSAAAFYSDALLRVRPQAMTIMLPTLITIAETPAARDVLAKRLSENPPWRSSFFREIKGHIRNPYVPLKLLLALEASQHHPTTKEIGAYLHLLLRNKLYHLSHYAWLQFLDPAALAETGLIYNGSFEAPLSGLPYDWTIGSSSGSTIEVAARDDRPTEHYLTVELGPGEVEFQPVSQLLALPPARYTLTGTFKGSILGERGLRWQIHCLPNVRGLAKTEMFIGEHPLWTRFKAAFEVSKDCTAQTLELVLDADQASDKKVVGSAQFDELAIVRN